MALGQLQISDRLASGNTYCVSDWPVTDTGFWPNTDLSVIGQKYIGSRPVLNQHGTDSVNSPSRCTCLRFYDMTHDELMAAKHCIGLPMSDGPSLLPSIRFRSGLALSVYHTADLYVPRVKVTRLERDTPFSTTSKSQNNWLMRFLSLSGL